MSYLIAYIHCLVSIAQNLKYPTRQARWNSGIARFPSAKLGRYKEGEHGVKLMRARRWCEIVRVPKNLQEEFVATSCRIGRPIQPPSAHDPNSRPLIRALRFARIVIDEQVSDTSSSAGGRQWRRFVFFLFPTSSTPPSGLIDGCKFGQSVLPTNSILDM
ncbi:hypothetical protein VPH35_001556 [Triticum aestivum]